MEASKVFRNLVDQDLIKCMENSKEIHAKMSNHNALRGSSLDLMQLIALLPKPFDHFHTPEDMGWAFSGEVRPNELHTEQAK